MSTDIKLRTAIHLALGLSAGALAFSHTPNVFAQDAADANAGDEDTVEEVIVTGSRIKRANLEGANPVTVVDRAQMEVTGLTDVGDLLQSMPSMSGSPIGTTTNNGGNGSVTIDLRGMGANRTVTLVNGHRTVDGGDFQAIPSTMIERVEILKNGASAIYGADAVAGVVNIITRRDFDGLEFSAQHAEWDNTHSANQDTASVIAGKEFAGGNFVFGAEYVEQDPAFQADVPWDFMKDSFYIYPEGCENQVAAPYDGTPSGGCYPIGSSAIPQGRWNFLTQGRFLVGTAASQPNEVGLIIPHDGRNYNYAPVNYLQTPYKRVNLFSEGHFELTDNIRFNAEIRGNFRESAQELAPTPYFSLFDPAFDGAFNGSSYHGISEQNYYLRRAVDAYNAANGTSLFYEPARDIRRRMFEQPRRFEQSITQYEFIAGLEGVFNDIDWDVFVNQGYRSREDQDFGQYVGDRLSKALGPSADLDGDGSPECYTDINDPSTLITGCVPLNIFGGGEVVRETGEVLTGSVTQDMLNYITATLTDHSITKVTLAGVNLSGSLWDLPGGEFGWAVGYNHWYQFFKSSPDSGKASGSVTGNKGAGTQGSLTNDGFYVEVLAPLYDNGSQSIDLSASWRYDNYDQFSGDDTYQFGIELQIVDDLKLRATYGTVFRAPTIGDLFGGQSDSFPTFTDPCAPDSSGSIAQFCDQVAPGDENQLLARVGGNPLLQPEKGDTTTIGVVWTPEIGDHNFTATVDYFEISLDDAISSLGVQFILEDCYERGVTASCNLITRRSADYGIQQVLDGGLNVAQQGAKGVDTELSWSYDASFGQVSAAVLWSHLIERTKIPFAGAPEQDFSGRYVDPTQADGGAYAKDKANFTLQWTYNDFSVSYLAEYIDGLDADTFCNCGAGNRPDGTYIQDISSKTYHDIVASYNFDALGTNTQITAGITNFTNEAPPFMDTGFNATTDPSTYRLFGRGYYVRLKWKY